MTPSPRPERLPEVGSRTVVGQSGAPLATFFSKNCWPATPVGKADERDGTAGQMQQQGRGDP